jgi:2-hydroxy-6-oxonona-2,4-dienedioate hydrolase
VSRKLVISISALVVAALAVVWVFYRRDVAREAERVAHGSQVANTRCGPIEYAALGDGPTVLLVHGAGGGFDQGLGIAQELAARGIKVVAMSRFGYLRTPLPADATPAAQADAHACLLDALGIERAAIVGISAGAPSSLQFALRHRRRTSALALVVPLAYAPRSERTPELSALTRFMLERAVRSDVLYWSAMKAAPSLVMKTVLATPPAVVEAASDAEQARVRELMQRLLPLSLRTQGLLNDAAVAAALERYPLENITARTLVISLPDDLYGTYASAKYTAAQIPAARFLEYPSGGHVWVGHHEEMVNELAAFLK